MSEVEGMDKSLMSRRLGQLGEELDLLAPLWLLASELQWEKAPVDASSVTLKRRAERPDPVADIVGDEARQHLRRQLLFSEDMMSEALVKVRGVRRGLEISLGRYGWEAECDSGHTQ